MRFLPIQYPEQLAGKAEPDKIRSVGSRNFTKIAVIKALSVANACAGSIKGKSGSGQKRRNRKSALSVRAAPKYAGSRAQALLCL